MHTRTHTRTHTHAHNVRPSTHTVEAWPVDPQEKCAQDAEDVVHVGAARLDMLKTMADIPAGEHVRHRQTVVAACSPRSRSRLSVQVRGHIGAQIMVD